MLADALIKSAISLMPVLIFLVALLRLDSYRLVRFHTLIKTMLSGIGLALVALALNTYAINGLKIDFTDYTHFAAPAIEEALKSLAVIYLFRTNRIGFSIDGIILGFAVGTGFALFENMFYLQIADSASIGDWVMRGFGTAIMHGGTTSIFGAIAYRLAGTAEKPGIASCALGLAVAIILHAIYNLFPGQPLLSAVPVLLALPLTLYFTFKKSEPAVHNWLVQDLETQKELLEQLQSGTFATTQAGQLVIELAAGLQRSTLAEVIEYLRIHTELMIHAKSILLAREDRVEVAVGHEVRMKFERLRGLERAIGKTPLLAIREHVEITRLDLWELYSLEGRAHDIAPHAVIWVEQAAKSWIQM